MMGRCEEWWNGEEHGAEVDRRRHSWNRSRSILVLHVRLIRGQVLASDMNMAKSPISDDTHLVSVCGDIDLAQSWLVPVL